MFLKAVTELVIDFDAVRTAMVCGRRPWLADLAEAAGDEHGQLLVDVGLRMGGRDLTRRATLDVGEPVTMGDRVVSLPLRLQMADHARLFPVLEGSLDAAWLGAGRTHLALAAQYHPPGGFLGRAADDALLHRVAELVAQRFLGAVAERLTALCAEEGRAAH